MSVVYYLAHYNFFVGDVKMKDASAGYLALQDG